MQLVWSAAHAWGRRTCGSCGGLQLFICAGIALAHSHEPPAGNELAANTSQLNACAGQIILRRFFAHGGC